MAKSGQNSLSIYLKRVLTLPPTCEHVPTPLHVSATSSIQDGVVVLKDTGRRGTHGFGRGHKACGAIGALIAAAPATDLALFHLDLVDDFVMWMVKPLHGGS